MPLKVEAGEEVEEIPSTRTIQCATAGLKMEEATCQGNGDLSPTTARN